jgi:hypothetical protein
MKSLKFFCLLLEPKVRGNYYKTKLKKYPKSIIKNPIIQKNVKSNFIFITFFSIKNSGSESPTTAIIKAIPVQSGIHFEIRA